MNWQGGDGFLLGANLPWYNFGCDFGCGLGKPESRGVSAESVLLPVSRAIGQASDAGMNVVRWWVFPGEPWQITVGPDELPSGIDDAVYADFDAALSLADLHDISYVFTIFSAPSEIPRRWLQTDDGRQRLADVLGELFAHYGDNQRILTWQLVNEPEWEIWNDIADLDDLRDLVAKVAASTHENSSALASIGSANLEGLELWQGIGLDYYTAHWYDSMDSGVACALCTSYSELAARFELDAPIVIGEFYGGVDIDPEDRLDSLYLKGYAGAWLWSLLPDQTTDKLAIDFEAATAFAERRSDDIGP